MKDKNHMIISTLAGRAFDKIQKPFMMKTLTIVGIEGTFINIIKAIMTNPLTISHSMGKNYKHSALRSGTRQVL